MRVHNLHVVDSQVKKQQVIREAGWGGGPLHLQYVIYQT